VSNRGTDSAPPKINTRPTLGFVVEGISGVRGGYQHALWTGVEAAARERNANLLCFIGGGLSGSPTDEFETQGNVIYEMLPANNVDGLIMPASVVGNHEFSSVCNRYRPLPIVSIGLSLPGIPGVVADNEAGMRAAVVHLIEAHGCRRIAFVRGPAGSEDADSRYRVYLEVLAAYGLPFDPNLVTAGTFFLHSGAEAIHTLLDERKLRPQLDFEALVCANDNMAFGALEVLQAREIAVPGSLALVGFDDTEMARCVTPPLTTVWQPTPKLGRQAVELLLAMLAGEETPEKVTVPLELVVRRSCGCMEEVIVQAAASSPAAGPATSRPTLATRREDILASLVQAIGGHVTGAANETALKWAERLLESFMREMQGEQTHIFLRELDEVLRQVTVSAGQVAAWHHVLSALRSHARPCLEGTMLARAEDVWNQARIIIGDAEQRAQGYHRLKDVQAVHILREIDAALITTFDVGKLMDVMAEGSLRLDMPSIYLALYENPAKPLEGSRLMLASGPHGRFELDAAGIPLPSGQLVPGEMWPQDRRYSFVVEPLHFQDHKIGFALFEIGPLEGDVYDVLRRNLSSALQGALLFTQIASANAEIKALNVRLQAENMRMEAELEVARRLQQMLLPAQRELDYISKLDIAGAMIPAEEVGGDYYDVLQFAPDQVTFAIGDVTGHGFESGVVMLMVQAIVHALRVHGETNLKDILVTLNQVLYNNLQRMGIDRTLTFMLLNYELGHMLINASGQHEQIIVVRQGGQVELIDTLELGIPLGIEQNVTHFINEQAVDLHSGDGLVLYSDGITEAENSQGDFYGLQRLCNVVQQHWAQPAETIKAAVIADVRQFIGDHVPDDDIALVIIKQR
jgi:sigma-B regulation protein RsbU (phosphoserine phosphatase)